MECGCVFFTTTGPASSYHCVVRNTLNPYLQWLRGFSTLGNKTVLNIIVRECTHTYKYKYIHPV